jgi:hypothetical protein
MNPAEGLTDLRVAAATAHEFFTELLEVGFAPHHAIYLVAQVITAGIRPPTPEAPA